MHVLAAYTLAAYILAAYVLAAYTLAAYVLAAMCWRNRISKLPQSLKTLIVQVARAGYLVTLPGSMLTE